MKVIFITNHFQRSDGVAQVLLNLCNFLAMKKDYEVSILPLYRVENDFVTCVHKKVKVIKGLGFYFRGLTRLISLLPIGSLRKLFGVVGYDVEIAFQSGLPTQIVGCNKTSSIKTVKVIWIHGFKLWASEFLNADIVVCISKWAKNHLQTLLPQINRVQICHNLIDEKRIKTLASKKHSKIEKIGKQGKIQLITVGRLSPEKGVLRFLSVLSTLKEEKGCDFCYWIVGDGPERALISKQIKELNLEDSVHMLGEQSNPYVYIKDSDLYVCPSYSEGYSTTCVEASILGVPVLTTDVPGAREIVEMAEAGMVVQNTERGLRDGLIKVIEEKKMLETWSKKLQTTSHNFFSSSKECEVEELFQLIENLLQRKQIKELISKKI